MAFVNNGPYTQVVGGLKFQQTLKVGLQVINKTGSSIAANKLVAVSGFDSTTKRPKIVLADADSVGLNLDVWVTTAAIADSAQGTVYKGALSSANLDTSSVTTVGDAVYLSTTAGAFTATAPTAANARLMLVGWVTVKSATVGQIFWHIGEPARIAANEFNGIGFIASGDGGAVTQLTNKSTGVTLSKKTGQITMNNANLAADTTVSFVLTNTFIEANDVLILNHISGGTAGSYSLNAQCGAGSATINVRNYTAGGLAEAIVISFVLVKAVIA